MEEETVSTAPAEQEPQAPSTPSLSQDNTTPHKSNSTVIIAIAAVVILLIAGLLIAVKMMHGSSYSSPLGQQMATPQASGATQPALNDNSDAGLNTDMQSVDTSMSSANSDISNADKSLNDQSINVNQ